MIYLDNAATTFYKPPEVKNAVAEALSLYSANPGRSGHELSVKTAEKIFEARESISGFFNGYGSEYVSFTSNCTQALNMAIKGILKRGDHVVISTFEHNSVLRPLYNLKQKGIVDYSVFQVFEEEEKTLQSFKNSFRKNTKLCVVTAVSNVFGNILPIEKLSRIAHMHNALFFVDGAQGAGVIPIDMKSQKIDCLCIPGHKGLYGPTGIGAIVHRGLAFDTLIEGGTGTQSFIQKQPEAYPERLESGTLNVGGIMGMKAGLEFVKNYGLNNVFNEETLLTKELFYGLKSIENVKLYSEEYNEKIHAPLLSFNIKGLHSEQVSMLLNEGGIAVRGGFHCAPLAHSFMGTKQSGTVRISPSIHNTKKEINILLKLVEKIAF